MSGCRKSTVHDGVVSVRVPCRGPYGVLLEDDGNGRAAIICEWDKLPSGKAGAIERHGGVRRGDVLVGVNETSTIDLPFDHVVEVLCDENIVKKVLHFASRAEVERFRASGSIPGRLTDPMDMGRRFTSRIRRARLSGAPGGGFAYAEYEIVCSLSLDSNKVEHVTVRKWQVWRRYSEFERLEDQVRKSLGWHIEGLVFPPKHPFVLDNLAPEFLEQRRLELDDWWQQLVATDRACDFHMHHCDPVLEHFLEVEKHVMMRKTQDASNCEHLRTSCISKGSRPASLKADFLKRRLTASSDSIHHSTTHAGSSPKRAEQPRTSKTDTRLSGESRVHPIPPAPQCPPRRDPHRNALLSQICALNLDD